MKVAPTDIPTDIYKETMFSLPPGRALDVCYEILSAILEHRIKPGAKLSEDELGDIFGVSRTVARSALQALAHGGLVTIKRNRGAFVAEPGTIEAHQVFEARILIEPRIARMAAEVINDDDISKLEDHLQAEHEALHKRQTGRALLLSGVFHLLIADISKQVVLAQILSELISRSSLIIALYWKRPDTTCESHSHHALMDAFKERNPISAQEIMKSHIIDLHSGLDLSPKSRPQAGLKDIFV